MNKRKGLTLLEALVVIAIIVLLVSILIPPTRMNREKIYRIICGTNLKGLSTAMTVYANDYDDNYPQLPGTGPWSKELGFAYDTKEPDIKPGGTQSNTGRTISASWYLLVRQADVSPKSYICPAALRNNKTKNEVDMYSEFDDFDPNDQAMLTFWDFGSDPYKYVSYAMHNPYGKFPANAARPVSFAVAADMSPWFKDGDIVPPGQNNQSPQIIKLTDPSTWQLGLSTNHAKKDKLAEGHNVTYADGHVSYETKPNVGVKKDNIFTFHSTDKDPTEQDIQGGTNPTGRSPENDAKSKDDSFLAI
jgi:prepilin-type processing-associated H-X9-DG protein